MLLEYALGTDRSYVFVVTSTTLQVFPLPKRADIEAAARRWLEGLRKPEQVPALPSLAAARQWLAQTEKGNRRCCRRAEPYDPASRRGRTNTKTLADRAGRRVALRAVCGALGAKR
ncbi:MAG: hypothetical protein U0Y68_16550 [Blastocatellia bacterium]